MGNFLFIPDLDADKSETLEVPRWLDYAVSLKKRHNVACVNYFR